MHLFYSIPWFIATPLVIMFIIALSIGGLLFVRTHFSHRILKSNNDVAGYTFGVLGVLYALQLGFIMLNVQQRYDRLHDIIHKEANDLAYLYRTSRMFPAIEEKVRNNIKEYMTVVIEKEYIKLASGEHDLKAMEEIDQLWDIYEAYTPKNEQEKIWFSHSLEKLANLTNNRLQRLHYSHEGTDPMMWTLMLGGGILVIGFMYLFGVDDLISQCIMIAALAGGITFILLIIIYLDNGFLGVEAIRFQSFQLVQRAFPWW